MTLTLTGLLRYPVKSGRGQVLTESVVERWGLAGDRRWLIAGADGEAITAREVPALLALDPQLTGTGLRLSAARLPGVELPDLHLDTPTGEPEEVTVHRRPVPVLGAGPEADAWCTQAIGRAARLFFQADPTQRRVNPHYGRPDDRVSLADAHPIHVITEASLAELNRLIAAGPMADQGPLPADRFRANLIVSGGSPWSEDGWRRIRIGDVVFRMAKGCERCVMTTVDRQTLAKGKEPIATLARHRRFGKGTWFGVDLIPEAPGGRLRVGDSIEVLEAGDPADGPLR